ncbi:HAD hydrolase-like protein [Candidatus Sumerlaeota bacterium]|nr:HAD hydrolase-like protein [Candidatus Sumerlaeota bacterium]
MTLKGIMFDLDGTLAETLPVCLTALRRTFLAYFGDEWSDERLLSCFGPTEEGVVKKLLPDKFLECLELYYDEYIRTHDLCLKPFPGMKDALDLLKQDNILMAIVTAKGAKTAQISLERLSLSSYFPIVEPGFEDASNKPASISKVLDVWGVDAGKIAYLGDRRSDIRAARETGLIPLAAAWSKYADVNLLKNENPDAVFSTVQEFIAWIGSVG